MLTVRGVPYNTNAPVWKKHMVKRILDNRRYLDNDCFPQHSQKGRSKTKVLLRPFFVDCMILRKENYKIPLYFPSFIRILTHSILFCKSFFPGLPLVKLWNPL